MPMVVYTEEEVIDACNKAAADAVHDVAQMRDNVTSENRALRRAIREACDMLAERTWGNPARSPGHNARLILETATGDGDARPAGQPTRRNPVTEDYGATGFDSDGRAEG